MSTDWARMVDEDEGVAPVAVAADVDLGKEYIEEVDGIKYVCIRKAVSKKVFHTATTRIQQWKKFGDFLGEPYTPTVAEVKLELGKAEQLEVKKNEGEIKKKIDTMADVAEKLKPADGVKPAAAADGPQKWQVSTKATSDVAKTSTRDDSNTVRVANLSDQISEDDLRALFQRFGRLIRVHVGKDPQTHERKGYAFVTFQEESAAEQAIAKLNRHPLNHLILSVSWAQQPAERRARQGH
eukprot:TRINITY_DN4736_c0_g1_i1.p1 TRINITY_DN4736_c0_g1~~TRINITY_DN4736_c0_g1_i1.p1  ORF type:complete len:239 (+),score=82.00 TRINITY_DN4736_c0_g1_i1:88-804(+)